MKTVYTSRLELVRFGKNEFYRDSDGKLYTKGLVPMGKLERLPMHTGRIRFVFSTKGAR